MIINKKFHFDNMHIVRDCSSNRCKLTPHSHTYQVEVKLESDYVSNQSYMVTDFGLLKGTVKSMIMSFNNSYSFWVREHSDYKTFIKSQNPRWVIMPVSPSAEMYSLMFYAIIFQTLQKTQFNNGEKGIILHSVVVHETITGSAEAFYEDFENLWLRKYNLSDVKYSQAIKDSWEDPEMWGKLLDNEQPYPFVNPKIELKYS